MALITTIIPTFRRPQLLRRAIQSSLAQSFTDLQVLVLDNASGDETAAVVTKLIKTDGRVKYHCHPENIGGGNNFQYGLQHVTTPFFSILSDDDILLPDFYGTAMQAFTDHPQASFVACGTLHITPTGDYYGMPVARLPAGSYRPPEGVLALLRYGHPEWTGILFRSAILHEIGFLDLETGHASDLDFELRAAARTSFVVSHQPAAIYSTQPLTPQTSGTYPFENIWPGWPRMIQNLIDDPRLPQAIKEEARWRLENQFRDGLFSLVFRYLYQNKIDDARKAREVLDREFNCRWQAGVLQIAIMIHKALGPDRTLAWWSFCRNALYRLKALGLFRTRVRPHESSTMDVTPYLKFLEL